MSENSDEPSIVDEGQPIGTESEGTGPPKRSHKKKPATKAKGPLKRKVAKKPKAKSKRSTKAKVKKPRAKAGKKSRRAKVRTKRAVKRISRGAAHRFDSALAQSAHDGIIGMLKGRDLQQVADKFKKSRSWINYLTHGKTTPSLETIEALAKGLGYKVTLSIRVKRTA